MELDPQITNRFKTAFEEGKTGRLDDFFEYLKRKKFKWEFLQSEPFSDILSANSSLFFNRDKEIEKVGRLIGFTLGNKKPGHLPIVGIEMVGRSTFLKILKGLMLSIDKELSFSWINSEIFEETDLDHVPRVLSWLDEIEIELPKVIFIEEAGYSSHIEKILERIFSIGFEGLLITTWTPEQWKSSIMREKSEFGVLLSNKLDLLPFKEGDRVDFLEFYISNAKEDPSTGIEPFDRKSLKLLANICEGIPGLMLEFVYLTLREVSIKENPNIETTIKKIAQRYSLIKLKERISNLSLIQKQILYKILISPDPRGISPIEIHQELRRDRTTISSYLMNFVQEGILERSKIGKYSYFRPSKLCKPFIQLAIQEDDLFLA